MAGRRRGAALEAALLEAAWDELTENGYANLTMEAVAARAGTSRPVIHRRWPDRPALIRAAVAHVRHRTRLDAPDTGSLRGDVLALMHEINRTQAQLITALSVQLAEYYEETGTSPSDLHTAIGGREPGALDTVYQRAAQRGEVDPERISNRIKTLPFTLLRQEMLIQLNAASEAVITEIVDTIFLPLIRLSTTESSTADADTGRPH